MQDDILIVGAGVFGLSAALALRQSGRRVAIVSAGRIPHRNAASNDISKVIRMEYGTDTFYMDVAARCMRTWRAWNQRCARPLFHETGFLLLSRNGIDRDSKGFERTSFDNLVNAGFKPRRLTTRDIAELYPGFAQGYYADGFYHALGGFAEAARTVNMLCEWVQREGVAVRENVRVTGLLHHGSRLTGVRTEDGQVLRARQYVLCTGAFTLSLLPELSNLLRVTAHPVFHIKPGSPELFTFEKLPVFAADIARSGWYGFPLHPTEGVVKIANHGKGITIDPEDDGREVPGAIREQLSGFLNAAMPNLANDPVVYARLCAYSDTADGHYLIDRHPDLENLIVAVGGSGHAFKMTPILGEWIASAVRDEHASVPRRFYWREPSDSTENLEEARFKDDMRDRGE